MIDGKRERHGIIMLRCPREQSRVARTREVAENTYCMSKCHTQRRDDEVMASFAGGVDRATVESSAAQEAPRR